MTSLATIEPEAPAVVGLRPSALPVATLTVGADILLSGATPELISHFVDENTFSNPKFETLERLGKWTGNTPRFVELACRTNAGLVLPRGFFRNVTWELRKAGIQFQVDDQTVCPTTDLQIDPAGDLFSIQERALDTLLQRRQGTLEGVTGCGKTNIGLTAAARLRTPTLFLVHTRELFQQTIARARQWLQVEPGMISGSKFELRPVTIAMVQTLARRDLLECGVAGYFGAVITDECHHAPATTWAEVLGQLPARYRYGLTATAWRKDGLGFLISRMIGPTTATISRAELEAVGRIVWPEIVTVSTPFYYDLEDTSQWTSMISELITDPERNDQICLEVEKRLTVYTKALILTDRIDHANALAHQLGQFSPVVLTGELAKAERTAAMQRVRDGARLTIATTHLLGEGIDVPGWDLLFLVSPIAGGPRTLQAVGRVCRPAPGKARATVVDFVDHNVPALLAAAQKRGRLYAA